MYYWVPRARKISKLIKKNCYMCRILDKQFCEQLMSKLPSSRLIPGPIWEHVTIDLFGPLTVRDSIKRRTCTIKKTPFYFFQLNLRKTSMKFFTLYCLIYCFEQHLSNFY